MVYQTWLVLRRPSSSRNTGARSIFAVSTVLNLVLIGGWVVFSVRYR
jgi:hypothetical protein